MRKIPPIWIEPISHLKSDFVHSNSYGNSTELSHNNSRNSKPFIITRMQSLFLGLQQQVVHIANWRHIHRNCWWSRRVKLKKLSKNMKFSPLRFVDFINFQQCSLLSFEYDQYQYRIFTYIHTNCLHFLSLLPYELYYEYQYFHVQKIRWENCIKLLEI